MSGVQVTQEAIITALHQHYGQIIAGQAQTIAEVRAANDVLLGQQDQRSAYFASAPSASLDEARSRRPPADAPPMDH